LKIHFIGIGGISMSALAIIYRRLGHVITGSDMSIGHEMQDKLISNDIIVYEYHDEKNITNTNPELVVYTAAIPTDNQEILITKSQNIELVERADFFGDFTREFEFPVAVSGTHGKTTTTAIAATVAIELGLDPTVLLGGNCDNLGQDLNFRLSESAANKYMIYEACEYVDSFLKFYAKAGIVLNIEADHLDYFEDEDAIRESFSSFIEHIPKDGIAIVNYDDKNIRQILESKKNSESKYITANIVTYSVNGVNDCDYLAKNIQFDCHMNGIFDVIHQNKLLGTIKLNVKGHHNVSNSLAVISLFHNLGMPFEKISSGISKFTGTERRIQIMTDKYQSKNCKSNQYIKIYDDYAHHPTEIRASLTVLKKLASGRLWCVFQSHTYSRTKKLLAQFVKSLSIADRLITTDIYAAREINDGSISEDDIAKRVKDAVHIPNFHAIAEYLHQNMEYGDMLVVMGAGNVLEVTGIMLEQVI